MTWTFQSFCFVLFSINFKKPKLKIINIVEECSWDHGNNQAELKIQQSVRFCNKAVYRDVRSCVIR